uniref:Uncharacterized protein n=1 Tax=Arundo donax TaxID=35708 RepID=A0A0A8Y2C4_ARUDO
MAGGGGVLPRVVGGRGAPGVGGRQGVADETVRGLVMLEVGESGPEVVRW